MKNLIGILTINMCILFIFSNSCYSEGNLIEVQRWDMRMIDSAPIWKNLLTNYAYAEHQKYWIERKSALEKIVNDFPNSQWADDAALILACGKFEFEGKEGVDALRSNRDAYAQGYFGNAERAIKELRNIINTYPNDKTIVSSWWGIGTGCKFDDIWLLSQGGLVFLNPDKSIRTSKPFDRNGYIHQQDKESLVYFDHLDKYPVYTKDVARVFISEILGHQGKFSEAASELEDILSDTNELEKAVRADELAVSDVNGYLIKDIDRPQYRAYISLIGYYEKMGMNEEKVSMTDKFAAIVNQGANIGIVKRIGEIYDALGLKSKAKLQYQIALNKLDRLIYLDRERSIILRNVDLNEVEENLFLIQKKAEIENFIKAN